MKTKYLVIGSILLLLLVGVAYLVSYMTTVHNISRVETYEIFAWQDSNATISLDQIDWGIVYNGETKNYTAYLTINSNRNATLNMFTDNWNPSSIEQYINCTWNAENSTIVPGEIKEVVFSLSVAENIPSNYTSFQFDIHLVATSVD